MIARFLSGLAVLLLGLAGCTWPPDQTPTRSAGDNPGSLLLLVAASTKDAVQEIGTAFTKETGIEVKISGEDSSKLAQQIVNGAPADLFISANEKWADFVKKEGFAQESQKLLGNTLVLVTPKGNPGGVNQPEDLTKAMVQKIAVAGPTVPAGIYARQALKHVKLWDELDNAKKVVSGDNVRVTLTYVERGEVEAGIVYSTDARITGKVAVVYTFPRASHDPIVYPLVLVKRLGQNPAARKIYDFLQSPAAAEIFVKHGFVVLKGPS